MGTWHMDKDDFVVVYSVCTYNGSSIYTSTPIAVSADYLFTSGSGGVMPLLSRDGAEMYSLGMKSCDQVWNKTINHSLTPTFILTFGQAGTN